MTPWDVVAIAVVFLVIGFASGVRWASSAPELPGVEEPLETVTPRLSVDLDRPVHLPPRRAQRMTTRRRSHA